MNSKSKLLFLLIPAGLSGAYFSMISGLDLDIFAKEISIVVSLQILALVYVGYYYRQKQTKSKL